MFLNPTEQLIKPLLDKITYKPGWTLSLISTYADQYRRKSDYEPATIYCTFITKDVDTGREIKLNLQHSIGPFMREDNGDRQLIDIIARVVRQFEDHEFKEWFKVDGFCVFDPHPEEKERKTYQLQGFQL